MSTLTIALLALATLVLGVYLGRRSTRHGHHAELASQARQIQRVIDFADEHIERVAPSRGLHIIRNADGHIVELATRCGTNALVLKEYLEERQRRKALH
jgi:hypothetical protein